MSPLDHLVVLKWLNLAKHRQKCCEYTDMLCHFFCLTTIYLILSLAISMMTRPSLSLT